MIYRIFVVIFFAVTISAQTDNSNKFEILPDGLHFLPLKAHFQEARIGVLYYPDNGNLKVDVGNNIDLVYFSLFGERHRFTLGIEFMAYAWSSSFQGNRLQIDAVDGFFGGNLSYSYNYDNSRFISRFRFIHNSAHLVDGRYDKDRDEWIEGYEPIPYTRDFAELTIGHQFYPSFGSVRFYGAVSYSTLVRPSELQRAGAFTGLEVSFKDIVGKIFKKDSNIFFAMQFSAFGNPNHTMDLHLMSGIKIGEWDSKGAVFYLSYYKGHHVFSEFYTRFQEKFGIGFLVDFI
ncbi:MAG: hypothetical protein PHW27_04485 [Melioribacteraceae bacterium]|nr:hypothetical protein [Melioribacteraceae bacterium]MDD3557811.1 hypothetical protein [Melioribacteraceae bacterium]